MLMFYQVGGFTNVYGIIMPQNLLYIGSIYSCSNKYFRMHTNRENIV